jgi:hypothetical protein
MTPAATRARIPGAGAVPTGVPAKAAVEVSVAISVTNEVAMNRAQFEAMMVSPPVAMWKSLELSTRNHLRSRAMAMGPIAPSRHQRKDTGARVHATSQLPRHFLTLVHPALPLQALVFQGKQVLRQESIQQKKQRIEGRQESADRKIVKNLDSQLGGSKA